MPEVLGDPPSPRTALFWNGTAWQWALVDAAGQLQVDVITSGLPAGAATAAAQALALAQLQLIEDMRDALQSVATDRLIVRGEDQVFSFKGVLAVSTVSVISGAGGFIISPAVPVGEIWIVTTITAWDGTTAVTNIFLYNDHNALVYMLKDELRAFAIGEASVWGGHTYLDQSDFVRVYFIGALAGDTCGVNLTGYRMTVET